VHISLVIWIVFVRCILADGFVVSFCAKLLDNGWVIYDGIVCLRVCFGWWIV
jgi:hypothetical protein